MALFQLRLKIASLILQPLYQLWEPDEVGEIQRERR
jgi:hypothetical protein